MRTVRCLQKETKVTKRKAAEEESGFRDLFAAKKAQKARRPREGSPFSGYQTIVESISLAPGERAGVRAGFFFDCIPTAQAIDAGLATWSDWVMGSVSTKHAPPLTRRSRHKSPPMLRLSLRHKASPRPTPGAEWAASWADLLNG